MRARRASAGQVPRRVDEPAQDVVDGLLHLVVGGGQVGPEGRQGEREQGGQEVERRSRDDDERVG